MGIFIRRFYQSIWENETKKRGQEKKLRIMWVIIRISEPLRVFFCSSDLLREICPLCSDSLCRKTWRAQLWPNPQTTNESAGCTHRCPAPTGKTLHSSLCCCALINHIEFPHLWSKCFTFCLFLFFYFPFFRFEVCLPLGFAGEKLHIKNSESPPQYLPADTQVGKKKKSLFFTVSFRKCFSVSWTQKSGIICNRNNKTSRNV